MGRFVRALTMLSALALGLAACASSKATGLPVAPTSPPAGSVCDGNVDMNDALKFVPENCTVKVNATVTWDNVGGLQHDVVSEVPNVFDSPTVAGGGEFKFTFKTVGSFPYFCSFHTQRGLRTGMIGTITVEPA
jgi:plastocyanin